MTTLTVGVGKQYTTIAAAIAASRDGDVLAVQAGTYTNDFATINTKITIEGVGGMVRLNATQAPPNGKAILTTNTDVTIRDVAFSGAKVADGNGAGIRYQGGNLVVEDCLFENNQNGLLANPSTTGTITIRDSEFAKNGTGDGYTHNLYVGEIAKLSIDNSYFHDAIVGHQIKSRAHETIVTHSRIADGATGTGSYSIDVPNGGKVVIADNVIEQGAKSQNPAIIHFGGEGTAYSGSSISITGNTVVNDLASPSASLLLNATSVQAYVANDSVFGLAANRIAVGPAQVLAITKLAARPVSDLSHPYDGLGMDGVPQPPKSMILPPSLPVPTDLIIRVSEDAWQGDAQFTVAVDGKQIGGIRTAIASHAAGEHNDVVISGLATGQHQVSVTFLNDGWGGSAATDRNLYVDSIAYAGQEKMVAAALLRSGTSTTTVGTNPPAAAHSLTLHLSEDAWQGDAKFNVLVDGKVIGSGTVTASHANGATQDFTFNGLTAVPKTVGVAFLNDGWGGSAATDRNLYVDGITIDGHDLTNDVATILRPETATFNVDPWG
ncbi:carbohydrate-binding domain-containing protein [Muricoccus vinaceus]|uniref:Carbohydrate-binding domain-containing protein n=1 Tax=Muricoccus vinaceus TaxID=424704 RepID=A0ABV6IS13_9PROT